MAPYGLLSIVGPEARNGHKTVLERLDGYEAHIPVDPNSEVVTNTTVTPVNTADAEGTDDLLDEGPAAEAMTDAAELADGAHGGAEDGDDGRASDVPADEPPADGDPAGEATAAHDAKHANAEQSDEPILYDESADGSGDNPERLERLGVNAMVTTPPPTGTGGRFRENASTIDAPAAPAPCPAAAATAVVSTDHGGGTAPFRVHCQHCSVRIAAASRSADLMSKRRGCLQLSILAGPLAAPDPSEAERSVLPSAPPWGLSRIVYPDRYPTSHQRNAPLTCSVPLENGLGEPDQH